MPPSVIALYVVAALIVVFGGFAFEHYIWIRPLEAREKARVEELVREKLIEAERLKEVAQQGIEAARKQALLETKEAELQLRAEMENEQREKRAEIQRLERRLAQREESLERRVESLEGRERQLQDRDAILASAKSEADSLLQQQREKLRQLAGLSRDEARALFLKTVEDDSRHDAAKLMRDIEDAARREGERKARQIVTDIIQRCSVDQTSET